MFIESMDIEGFCCYSGVKGIPFHKLTVFIGENDAGKTMVLRAVELFLSNKQPTAEQYMSSNGSIADEIVIEATFLLEARDEVPPQFRSSDGTRLKLIKRYQEGQSSCFVEALAFDDDRLNKFASLSAPEQKVLLEEYGLTPAGRKEERAQQVEALKLNLPTKLGLVSCSYSDLQPYMPRFEYISSASYADPNALIQNTLKTAVSNCLRRKNPETGAVEMVEEFVAAEAVIKQALSSKVSEMQEILAKHNAKISSVDVKSNIDFSKSLASAELAIDVGKGLQSVNSFGEGTKKKLWMSLLDWNRDTQKEATSGCVIRAYDEPDVNLDYSAERKLFNHIIELTSQQETAVQAIVCTHSITMVDRAPASSINLIRVSGATRDVEYLRDDASGEVEAFLGTVGRVVGVTNSALFYERAFLVVEGESEENALPKLYKKLYGKSLIEDGIVLINLQSCGAWRQVLRVLLKNKAGITYMMLDSDVKSENSGAQLDYESLEEIGFPQDFIEKQCVFIGDREFEDSFSSTLIVEVLNRHWPREDGGHWDVHQVDGLRNTGTKFSQGLRNLVYKNCQISSKSTATKPEIASRLADCCSSVEHVPHGIRAGFEMLRQMAEV